MTNYQTLLAMDFALAFAVLLYLNVYYFGFFACFEFALLVFKVCMFFSVKPKWKF